MNFAALAALSLYAVSVMAEEDGPTDATLSAEDAAIIAELEFYMELEAVERMDMMDVYGVIGAERTDSDQDAASDD